MSGTEALRAAEVLDATGELAQHALRLEADELPAPVEKQARAVLADTIGVLLASSRSTAVRTTLAALRPAGGPCTVVGHGRCATPEAAALVNGIAGHHIELDDFHAASRGHVAAVVVPAALAAAEVAADCSYGDLLAGIVAAYDVQARVSSAMGPEAQYDRGFHPTSVCGAIGAAVCAGRILGLSLDEMRSCVGLAAAQCSGLLNFVEDASHMQKSFQHGVAARSGVTAALLAGAGFRAAPDALGGRFDVLTPFGGPAADPSRLRTGLGERFEICETTIKLHACCAMTHAAIDALLDVMQEADLTAASVERIDVRVAHKALARVDANPLRTHNLQHLLALAAHVGRIDVSHHGDDWAERAEIAELERRVTVRGDDALQRTFPERIGAVVTVTTAAGELVRRPAVPRGHPDDPLTDGDLRAKFVDLAETALDPARAATLWETLRRLETGDAVAPLFDLLSAQP